MEVGIEAACWVVGKALGPVSGGVLEAWAASTELGPNIRALRMELLYAQGMLNNARGRGRGRDQEMQNPALAELLQELRDLGYRANDVLDELDYFRIQDELDGTYHAANEHEGGCLSNCALNARHTARAIANMLGFSKCSSGGDSHGEPAGEGKREGGSRGPWPCIGLTTPSDDAEGENRSQRGVICGGLWPCRRASTVPPSNQQGEQGIDHSCMGRLASGARNTIHTVGKHLPCHSVTPVQNDSKSNMASSERRRFLCCAWPNKAPQREHIVQTPKLKFNRVEMSHIMKEIVEQLKPVCAKVSTILNLELLDSNHSVAQWIATSLEGRVSNKQWHTPIQKIGKSRPITTSEFIDPNKFHGRVDETRNIIHDITKGQYCDKTPTVLPIVGPGGIGKTTLAQYIYNCVELQKHFEVKLWVCVSVNFNVYRLTQEIVDKLSNEKKDSPDKLIEEKLKSKRFLIVLDDMWNCSDEDEWKRFLMPFTKGQTKGSVILVTTRFPAVAQMVKTVDSHIDLEGLDPASFKQLFLAYVFGDKETPNDHTGLFETADMILEKLKGSPLAAKTVGRLLRNNLDLDHWTKVLESREWESQEGDHDIMPALKLSFDYLPFHLQQCFTYCALFPEDYRFGREELIHFWIGLDALHSHSKNISIEDIGLRHLNELVDHGFLKTEEKEDGGTCYVIHDLLHELALKVSAHESLNIYSSSLSSTQIFPSIRHLSISIDDSSVKDRMTFEDCKEKFGALAKRLKVENLHSLMIFGEHQESFVKTFSDLFSKAKSLRVIFLSKGNYSMEYLLPNYLNLIHLRYLRLSGVLGPGLSKNISRYYHLRVLHVHCRYQPYDLTRDISNLIKLRHFLVLDNGEMHSRISKVGSLKWLQGLQRFVVKKESQGFELSQIGNLPELKGSLRIENLEKVESREEAEEAKLMHKKHLREVLLNWDIGRSNKNPAREEQVLEGLRPYSNLQKLCIECHAGVKCPSWLDVNLSVKSLESLCLDSVAWKTFPPIGINEEIPSDVPNKNFHYLREIKLVNLDGVRKWVVDTTCPLYSCLETLIIQRCSELMELSFSNSTCGQNTWFPKLRVLEIEECPKLSSLPPVPWTRAPCKIRIRNVSLVFERLDFGILYDNPALSLKITGKNAHQRADEFWMALDFDNLTELKCLNINECPPLPLDRLKMLSSIKDLSVSGCNNAFWLVEEGSSRVQFQLPVESIRFEKLDASGKELTQVLSCMPKLLKLEIYRCNKITTLGVVEQQEKATSSVRRGFPRWVGGPEAETQVKAREEEETSAVEESILFLPPQLQRLWFSDCREICLRPDDSVGLQGLCSLRFLSIDDCPKFFSSYLSPSSSFLASPFPTSLQKLVLYNTSLTIPPPAADCCVEVGKMVSLSNLASLTLLHIDDCGDLRGFWRSHLPRGCLNQLSIYRTRNFFFVDDPSSQQQYQEDHGLSSSSSPFSVLQSLYTDDAAGVFAAPICSLLSSSLTELVLLADEEIERFTEQQEEALQLLTALQQLQLGFCRKLQCLPASGLRGLPNLKRLWIVLCSAIVSLPKGGLPNSLQELKISDCPAIRTLGGLPNSLQKLEIYSCPAIMTLPKDGLPNSLQELEIISCSTIRTLRGLPNSLQSLDIRDCPAIRTLPKDGLPDSLQELVISSCPAIRALPKDRIPSSLRLLDVRYCDNEELKGHCRKQIGTIPIVRVSD